MIAMVSDVTGQSVTNVAPLNLTDVDECATGAHGCEQQCENSHGSYSCACDSGYRLETGVASPRDCDGT